jgi:WhiB family redox-sensing transcriptional regulator
MTARQLNHTSAPWADGRQFSLHWEAVLTDTSWQDKGRCAEVDPEAWFPEKGGSAAPAKKICRGCPVVQECLEYALTNDIVWGIWGATSPKERRRLRRSRAQEAAA